MGICCDTDKKVKRENNGYIKKRPNSTPYYEGGNLNCVYPSPISKKKEDFYNIFNNEAQVKTNKIEITIDDNTNFDKVKANRRTFKNEQNIDYNNVATDCPLSTKNVKLIRKF